MRSRRESLERAGFVEHMRDMNSDVEAGGRERGGTLYK